MNLLCAIMIGTRCLMFHPMWTKKWIENTGQIRVQNWSRQKNKISAMGIYGSASSFIELEPICRAEKIAYLMGRRLAEDQNVEWSCTQGQIDDYQTEQIKKNYTPMTRQHYGLLE